MNRIQSDRSNGYFFELKNYLYTKDRKQNGTIFFSCHKKRYHNCMGRATWKLTLEPIITRPHNHDPEPDKVAILLFKEALRRRAATELLKTPATIYQEEALNFVEAACTLGVFSKKIENMMMRSRKSHFPPIPETLEDVDTALKDAKYAHLATELGPEEEPFYCRFISANNTEDLIYFISPTIQRELPNLINSSIRGLKIHLSLFKFAPREGNTYNLFIVNVIYKNYMFPILYSFLQNTTQTTYKKVLQQFSFLIKKKNISVALVITDYDKELRNATKVIFPQSSIISCWFYFCKNIYLKARELGLSDSKIKMIRATMALPHLPNTLFNRGIELIEQQLVDEAEDVDAIATSCRFIQYLRSHWTVQEMNLYKTSMKINGSVDAIHSEFYRLLIRGYSNFWTFLIALQKKEFSKSRNLIDLQNGKVISETVRTSYKKLIENVEHFQNLLSTQQLDLRQFLNKLGSIMESLEYSWSLEESPVSDLKCEEEILFVVIDDKIGDEINDASSTVTADSSKEIREIVNKEEALSDCTANNLCRVCNDSLPESAFIPCGHRCVCAKCGKDLNEKNNLICPVCSLQCNSIVKIIL